MQNRFYANVVSRWQQEIAEAAEHTLLFSPFITQPTIKTVLQASSNNCEIYTVFSALNFASGSSSLKALKWLVQEGFEVFHLEGLHAKILYSNDQFVSVGSQNLTGRGTRNLEGTIATTDQRMVKQVYRRISGWIENRIPITLDMIDEMEEGLDTVKVLLLEALTATAELDAKVFEAEENRQETIKLEEEKRLLEEKAKEEERQLTEQIFREGMRSLENTLSKRSTVGSNESVHIELLDQTIRFALVPLVKEYADLNSWLLNRKRYTLLRLHRYLCLDKVSGKLAWIRLGKTRISYFKNSRDRGYVYLNDMLVRVEIFANWISPPNLESSFLKHNLTIRLRPLYAPYSDYIEVDTWFSVDALRLIETRSTSESKNTQTLNLKAWIKAEFNEFERQVIPHILKPFKYEKALSGGSARDFLLTTSGYYKLTLHAIQGNQFFVLSTS